MQSAVKNSVYHQYPSSLLLVFVYFIHMRYIYLIQVFYSSLKGEGGSGKISRGYSLFSHISPKSHPPPDFFHIFHIGFLRPSFQIPAQISPAFAFVHAKFLTPTPAFEFMDSSIFACCHAAMPFLPPLVILLIMGSASSQIISKFILTTDDASI